MPSGCGREAAEPLSSGADVAFRPTYLGCDPCGARRDSLFAFLHRREHLIQCQAATTANVLRPFAIRSRDARVMTPRSAAQHVASKEGLDGCGRERMMTPRVVLSASGVVLRCNGLCCVATSCIVLQRVVLC
jgi:hypothetical protein